MIYNIEEVKEILTPIKVVQYYLGEPDRNNRKGLWYKSPFRKEKTASFLVNDEKGIHDFGTSEHYDIISFVQQLFQIDFVTALNKLFYDFGIDNNDSVSENYKNYLIRKKEEELEIKRKLEDWFNKTYVALCKELDICRRLIPHLRKEALVIMYKKEVYIEYLLDIFLNATEEEKLELWRTRNNIQKYIE